MDEDRNAPPTRGDLKDLEARLEGRMREMEARLNERHDMLRAEMQHSYDDLKEMFRDAQTELLKAFYNFAQINGERVASVESDTGSSRSASHSSNPASPNWSAA